MAQILVFGASGTWGAWDLEKGGWVNRLRLFLDSKDDDSEYLVYNLGISGDTTEDLLGRFEFETEQRIDEEDENKETILIFSIGVNDSQFIHSQNKQRILPDKFKENVQKLIKLAQKYSSKIIFLGFAPVDESKTTPIPWNTDKSYKNEYIQRYNEILKSACKEKENKIQLIDIFEKMMNSDYKKLLEDGLHPNSKGHEKIFEIVRDFLIKNKII